MESGNFKDYVRLSGRANYRLWSIQVRGHLHERNLWDVVEFGIAKTEADINAVGRTERANDEAFFIMAARLSNDLAAHIEEETSAHILWKKFESMFTLRSNAVVAATFRRYMECKYEGDITKYFSLIESAINQIKCHSSSIDKVMWL
ncbi:hypothetical protein H4S01_004718, partial [Coemansia sp. RSA 2610]